MKNSFVGWEIDEPSVRISHILEFESKYDICVLMLSSATQTKQLLVQLWGINCAHVKIFIHNVKARHTIHETKFIDGKTVLENKHRITFSDSISPVTVVNKLRQFSWVFNYQHQYQSRTTKRGIEMLRGFE